MRFNFYTYFTVGSFFVIPTLVAMEPTEVQLENPGENGGQKLDETIPKLFMPQPVRGIAWIDENAIDDNYRCPLVALLEEQAEEIARWEQRQRIEAQALAFKYIIIEPIRAITKLWKNRLINDREMAYWQIRQYIEFNLPLFRSASITSIKNLRNVLLNSRLPNSIKNDLVSLMFDYHRDYHGTFWNYHAYVEIGLFACHYLTENNNEPGSPKISYGFLRGN